MVDKQKQSYAPFGSISKKVQKNKIKPEYNPGPGSYEVSFPLIPPIVQTIRKKNNNVIVKLNHVGTSAFQTEQSRFNTIGQNDSIGPGTYTIDSPQKKYHRNKARSVAGQKIGKYIVALPKLPTIQKVQFLQLKEYIDMPMKKSTRLNQKQRKKSKGLAWSPTTDERSKKLFPQPSNGMGPGFYEVIQAKKNNKYPSSAFASQSIRSFFDQIYYNTNQALKAKIREDNHYKSNEIGPGSYELSQKSSSPSKISKYQFFGSTEQRSK